MSVYGYPRPTTPRLEQFARDALVFRRAYATASWTRPSVASILTGLSPRHHGAVLWNEGLGNVETLAERLTAAGYRSRALIANAYLRDAGFERGFESFLVLSTGGNWNVPGAEVTQSAVTNEPFAAGSFLYLHYLDPHDPYAPAPRARAEFVRPYVGPYRGDMGFTRGVLLAGAVPWTYDGQLFLSDLYDAEVKTADDAVGRALDWVREAGLYDEAIIIVTADHGEEFHDHGGWFHGYTLYDEQLHVPLLIKFPASAQIGAGVRNEPVSIMDIVPTLVSFLALDRPGDAFDGLNLIAAGGERPREVRTLYAMQPLGRQGGIHTGTAWAARRDGLKWIELEGSYPYRPTPPRGECYDLAFDPGERTNLVATEPERCSALAKRLALWRLGGARRGPEIHVSEEERLKLEALGYTN